jgi:hypothetical protein
MGVTELISDYYRYTSGIPPVGKSRIVFREYGRRHKTSSVPHTFGPNSRLDAPPSRPHLGQPISDIAPSLTGRRVQHAGPTHPPGHTTGLPGCWRPIATKSVTSAVETSPVHPRHVGAAKPTPQQARVLPAHEKNEGRAESHSQTSCLSDGNHQTVCGASRGKATCTSRLAATTVWDNRAPCTLHHRVLAHGAPPWPRDLGSRRRGEDQ